MTSKERLRALLDERGIEYTICMPWNDTAWEHDGTHFTATERFGKIYLQMSQGPMTPEQAIAATVGVGTCHMEPDGHYGEEYGIYKCSNCGELWQFDCDGPREHGWTCCPKCQARIKEVTE